jgi:hypothetical protein
VRYLPSWFPGVRFHAFGRKIKEDLHNAMTRPVEHVAERLKVEKPRHGCPSAPTDRCAQSGAKIDTSVVSTCLEDPEDMNKKGVNREVICNTAGVVYIGRWRPSTVRFLPSDCPSQGCLIPYV